MTDPLASAPKDCKNCPSFLEAHEAPGTFNRSIGSSICASHGYALGVPRASESQNKKLRIEKASNCPDYGHPKASQPRRETFVMLPDPVFRDPANIDIAKQDAVNTCSLCTAFIGESVVYSDLGWTAGLCAAKGKLLMTNRLSQEANGCEYRQFGPNRGSTTGLNMLPEYSESFLGGPTNPIAVYMREKTEGRIEPGEWPTDKEVTEDDIIAGIKAWRKFDDPSGLTDNSVYFPVFDAAYFDDDQRELIPVTGSDEHPELYVDHFGGMYALGVAWMELDETPALWAVPGAGKTELLRYASWIMQAPFNRVSITASSEVDDVIGKMMYTPERGTFFSYGVLPEAWQRPGVLCLDEPNVAKDPAVWHAIRPLTDNSKQLVIDQNEHEHISRNTDCYLGLCMNPAWDMRNVGAMEIADADVNRLFHIWIDMPPEELEREIIAARVKIDGWELSSQQMDSLMKTAKDIRANSAESELPITWAIRPQLKVARALKWFDPITAYRRAVADFLEPDAQQILFDQVRANWTLGN